MAKWKQTVRAILADMSLSTVAAKEVADEVRKFRKGYADEYQIDLTLPSMQDPRSERVQEMARTYLEEGLPKKGILPGRSRWIANVSAAQTEQPIWPLPKQRILELLQKLIAHQNWNTDRSLKYVPREETSSPISSDSEQNYAVGPTRGRGPCGTRSGLRSSGLNSVEESTENSQVAPVAKMEPNSGNLERTDHYTYDGLPDTVDLEAHENPEAMTSEPMRDDHHVLPEATLGGISADAENHQGFLSGLADLSPAFEECLENTVDTSHQQSPTQDDSGFQQHTQQCNLGQTSMVGPNQRPSKVIVLKWKQHKRRAIQEELPHSRSTKESLSLATVSQNDSIDEGTKRRRLGDMDSIPALSQPIGISDSINSGAGYPSHVLELPADETHQSERFQAISKLSDGGAESVSPKERSPRTGSTPSVPHKVREQEQAHQGPGDSKVGFQWSSWLLDPRKPGGALRHWPGNKPFSQTIHYVFEKTTELLETDRYSGIQFLFKLNDKAGEVIFQVTKNAPEEFEIMKENAPRKLKEIMIESGKKATAIDITLRPVGLTQVGSSESASAATVEDEDLYGIDALFE